MKNIILTIFTLAIYGAVYAQHTLIPADPFYQTGLDRYRILRGVNTDDYFSNVQPLNRRMAVALLDTLDSAAFSSQKDKIVLNYLKNDNWNLTTSENKSKKPFLKHFYQNKTDLYSVDNEDITLRINPVFYFSGGKDSETEEPLFINTRAAEVRAVIDNKVGFYTFLSENQVRYPEYVRSYGQINGVIPGEGFKKSFKGTGYDFFQARGYIDFNASKHINIQFGHDRFKIGQGIRSIFLSDQAPPYLFMKIQTQVWKFNYTNLFTQFVQDNQLVPAGLDGEGRYPNKYMSLHHLSLNVGKKLNIGFFEWVMYGADNGGTGRLDPAYLNPVIFYRAVEHQNGSADNVQVGMDMEWLITKGVSAYGQFLLDEFKLEHLRNRDGWWGNKYGLLVGAKYINAFNIDHLDLTTEYSMVRPYTYSHHTKFGSYSHFLQPLAHIRGANFKELIFDIKYQVIPRLHFKTRLIYSHYGSDATIDDNWGGDILQSYRTREQEFNNVIGQGLLNKNTFISTGLSYMLKQGLFVDLRYIYRDLIVEDPTQSNTAQIVNFSLRMNIAEKELEF